jgi:hypothetical protein
VHYEIRVSGVLSSSWSAWFEGLQVVSDDYGQTIIAGPIPDQAALHGLLAKIRDLALELLEVRRHADPCHCHNPATGERADPASGRAPTEPADAPNEPGGGAASPCHRCATQTGPAGSSDADRHDLAGMSSRFVICRVWRGWTTKNHADAYEHIVRRDAIPAIEARRLPGLRAIDLVRSEREHDVEFMTLMWFDSLDSMKGFSGEYCEVAHVPPQARAVLADFDKRPAHYEVLDHREQPR